MSYDQNYIFEALDYKIPRSSRKVYIRRLADTLQLSIHQRDWPRAKRAWSILTRCPEFEWKNMWQTGLLLIQNSTDSEVEENVRKCLEYLRVMMLRCPEHKVAILQEIILWLIKSNRHQDAFEELELYLPSFPYQECAVLHIYAGLLCLFLAHFQHLDGKFVQHEDVACVAPSAGPMPLKQAYLRDCWRHLRRAADLDPEHPVPPEVLLRLRTLNTEGEEKENDESDEASEVNVDEDDGTRPTKRKC